MLVTVGCRRWIGAVVVRDGARSHSAPYKMRSGRVRVRLGGWSLTVFGGLVGSSVAAVQGHFFLLVLVQKRAGCGEDFFSVGFRREQCVRYSKYVKPSFFFGDGIMLNPIDANRTTVKSAPRYCNSS